MLPFEFIIEGPPRSQQTKDREKLSEWRGMVHSAAAQLWPGNVYPIRDQLQITVVYYHDGATARIDNDNLIKPIQDALMKLIYDDDSQITDTHVRKTSLDGHFRVRGMSPMIARGFCEGKEFIYVKIEDAPDHAEIL